MKLQTHILYLSSVLMVCVWSCPSPLCTCNLNDKILCSNRRLERVPHFASRTSDKVYEELDLSQNEIESVPPNAFQAVQTKFISLSHNPLIGISPRAFHGLEDVLQKLDLYDTEIYVLHWGVLRNLHGLTELNLGRNGMFALPTGFFDGLINLQKLGLEWNKIATIKTRVFNLLNLQTLNLLGNQITEIEPGSFENVRKLHTLNLNNNQLRHINPLSVQGLHNLENLLLEGNLLSDVPSAMFILLPSITSINLAKNNVSILPSTAFNGATNLQEILLQENNIYNISSNAFLGLSHLQKLRLDDNKLQTFGEDCILRGVQIAREVGLRNNPVDCTCRIAWIHELNSHGIKVDGECVSPAVFSGIQLNSLNFTLCDSYKCI